MAVKSFNRTVEAINDLLDKLDNLPDYPLVFKGGLNNPSYLPSEATQGDLYLVMYANNDNTGLANSLYYRTHTNQWDIIANISYTKAQIDDKLDNIADNAELSTYTEGAGTSFETVANTDTVTDAIEKVQNNALLNKNNILSLSPTAYTVPRPNTNYNITVDSGGYFLCGKICFVNVRLTVGTDIPNNTYFLYDLPEALTSSSIVAGASICALSNNRDIYISVTTQGNVLNASGAAITAGLVILTGAYLIA